MKFVQTNILLPPATKLRQGNVFTPVCHSAYRGGVYQTPPGQTSPLGRHPLGSYPLGRHHLRQTPLADTPPADPPADNPQDRHPTGSACWDTVNKWSVHILLECILVSNYFVSRQIPTKMRARYGISIVLQLTSSCMAFYKVHIFLRSIYSNFDIYLTCQKFSVDSIFH